jgi:drug/metabolite transporter (DMT)-like permease
MPGMTQTATLTADRLSPRAATALIALAATCFGLVPLFARELQALGLGAPAVALYRYVFSATALAPLLPLRREVRREALIMAGAGVLVGVGWIGYLEAVAAAPVAAAGVIYMSYPLFAVGFAWLLLGQRPGPRAWGAGALVLAAAALVLDPAKLSGGSLWALVWSLPAPITFGLVIVVLSGLVNRLTPPERLACSMTGASAGLLPLALMPGTGAVLPALDNAGAWVLIAGLTLSTALVPQLLYTAAAPRVGPARSAAAGSFELPTMFAIGWLAFAEPVGPRELVSAALVLSAILLAPAVRGSGGPGAARAAAYGDR